MAENIGKGLESVPAAASRLAFVDGVNGILRYCGYAIGELAEHATFEEAAYLLWFGELPAKEQLSAFDAQLRQQRTMPASLTRLIVSLPRNAAPLDVLRTVVSALGLLDPAAADVSRESVITKAIRLTALFPAIVAACERLRQGKHPLEPDPKLSHAANFLYLLRGERATPFEERVMDACLVLHAEHELNASSFAARVAASTLADPYAAVTAALATLQGPLHGGANEHVLRMIREIEKPDKAEQYILAKLKRKERIMGFGHRVYKVKDPRAHVLQKLSRSLAQERGAPTAHLILEEVERIVERELAAKKLFANVDFYAAGVYHYLGLHERLFPAVFACSRIAGWMGHLIEQYADNRLIRPLAVYTGVERRTFVPMERR